jgi:hypothetical protein
MLAGEKEQLNLAEIPAHDREIALLNAPDCGVAVTVKCPDSPAEILSVEGDAPKDTVGGGVALHPAL